jgi:hypothetical protein
VRNTGIAINYYHRRYNNLVALENLALSPSDYAPAIVTNPLTSTPFTIYNQNPGTVGLFNNVVTNASQLNRTYDAVELTFDRRFSNNVTVFGGITRGASKGCDG